MNIPGDGVLVFSFGGQVELVGRAAGVWVNV